MVEIIELLIYLLTEILNYTMAYSVVFEMNINRSIKRWLLVISIIIPVHIAIFYFTDATNSRGFSMLTMLLLVGLIISGDIIKKFLLYPIIFVGVGSIASSMSFALGMMLNIPEYDVVKSSTMTIICQIIPIVLMLLVVLYRKVKKYEKMQLKMDFKQYLMFYGCTIATFTIISSLQMISELGITEEYVNYYGLSTSFVCVGMVLLIVWQSILLKREVQYKKQNEMYNMYMKLQEERVKEVVAQDEKMRRFRHDLKNHFAALSGYVMASDMESIGKYLQEMNESVDVAEYKDYTGNIAVDAIIRQNEEFAKNNNIQFVVDATNIENEDIAVFDLCTIISNIIKNALEACLKITEVSNRKVVVSICTYESKICIFVKNTVAENVKITEGKLITTKGDFVNHGLGSGNVERTVRKYNGVIKYKCENMWFETEIVM